MIADSTPAPVPEPVGAAAPEALPTVRLHPDDIVAIARALYAERNRLVNLKELAEALGMPYSTLQHKAETKRLPFCRVGHKGVKMYNVEEVLAAFRLEPAVQSKQSKRRTRDVVTSFHRGDKRG